MFMDKATQREEMPSLLSSTEEMPVPKSRRKKSKRDVESVEEPDGENSYMNKYVYMQDLFNAVYFFCRRWNGNGRGDQSQTVRVSGTFYPRASGQPTAEKEKEEESTSHRYKRHSVSLNQIVL